MASISTCPYCGSLVRSDQANCPGCGAANESFLAYTPGLDLTPRTIAELKDYCSVHKIPLAKLRFFVGEDYREPRAYGIYRDGATVIAYKNKSDGSRSIGYQGTDEAAAVEMFYEKLLKEYRKLGVSPEEDPVSRAAPQEPVGPPRTIEELQAYCDRHGMPLKKMRFFIGEDYPYARAFGIYRDGDEVVVYKNKDNGERAVRYRGKFEERGVKEIYDKLLDECHRRGIYPDGKPVPRPGGGSRSGSGSGTRSQSSRRRKKSGGGCLSGMIQHDFLFFMVLVILGAIVSSCSDSLNHRNDGYFRRPGDDRVYYHYGDDWYYTYDENASGYWYEADDFQESEAEAYESLGDSWSSDWGVSDFRESSTWDDLHTSSSSSSGSSDYDSWDSSDSDWGSSDYDSWDSGDTDWDSDW